MAFVFKITTTTSPQTFTIPCQNVGTFNATIDWGDGSPTSSITAYNDADLSHSYATAGQYTITITGTFPNIYFNNGGDRLLVDEVVDLGDVGWTRLDGAFFGCSNMTAFDGGTANTSSVTNMFAMFRDCSSLTSLDVSGFDTSSVTNMRFMFQSCSSLTGLQISSWDVSSVTDGTDFLNGANAALSQEEYDATLLAWAQQPVQSGVTWHFGDANYSNTPIAVSIQMDGRMTYADDDSISVSFYEWEFDGNNRIRGRLNTIDGRTGGVFFDQRESGVEDIVTSLGYAYSPGINVPFNIASRHGSTFINGAVDGTALTADTTPTALPDLSATDLQLGFDYMGTVKKFRIWNEDIGDTGIAEASEGEPSSYLLWDATADTYIQRIYD